MCFLQLLICWFRWRAGDEIRPAPCSRNWRTLALSVHYRSGTLPLMNIETKTRLNWVASLLLASQAAVSFAASPPNTLTDSELQAGWKLLFDGKTTTGWRGYKMDKMPPGWAVIDGVLVRVKGGEGGKGAGGGDDIVTTEEFENFDLTAAFSTMCPRNRSRRGIMRRKCRFSTTPRIRHGASWSSPPPVTICTRRRRI